MIEQNEFLDIIVMLDKGSLQVPLQEDSPPVGLSSAQGWGFPAHCLISNRESVNNPNETY